MNKKFAMGFFSLLAATLIPTAAFAEGAVKVECYGQCQLVNLGQVCDTYSPNSTPVAVSCDDTGLGNGTNTACGGLTCRPWGSLYRGDLLSGYCDDGPGLDAVVTCRIPGTLSATQGRPDGKTDEKQVPKIDDGLGRLDAQ
jgi:hypothetical protein